MKMRSQKTTTKMSIKALSKKTGFKDNKQSNNFAKWLCIIGVGRFFMGKI